ncbi:MAG: cell division protein FtsA, partial [Ilumatobacteraceae bacterium]
MKALSVTALTGPDALELTEIPEPIDDGSGVIVDMASTEQAIQRAVEEAELMAGCEIHSVYAGISGSHIRSLNSDGTVAIKDKEVTEGDVERVLDAARAVPVAADQKILHVL